MPDVYLMREAGTGHVLNRFLWESGTDFPSSLFEGYPPNSYITGDDGTPIWTPPPDAVTPLQFRKAVKALGLKTVFEQFLQMQGPDSVDEIEYAISIQRLHPLVEQARLLLNMSEDQRDNLFRLAASFV